MVAHPQRKIHPPPGILSPLRHTFRHTTRNLSFPHHALAEIFGDQQGYCKHAHYLHSSEPHLFLRYFRGQKCRNCRNANRDEQPKQGGKIVGIEVIFNHIACFIYFGAAAAQPINNKVLIHQAVRNKLNRKQQKRCHQNSKLFHKFHNLALLYKFSFA